MKNVSLYVGLNNLCAQNKFFLQYTKLVQTMIESVSRMKVSIVCEEARVFDLVENLFAKQTDSSVHNLYAN